MFMLDPLTMIEFARGVYAELEQEEDECDSVEGRVQNCYCCKCYQPTVYDRQLPGLDGRVSQNSSVDFFDIVWSIFSSR